MSSLSVQGSPILSEALRHVDNILFSVGMQSTGSQDPWQKSCGAVSIHLSVTRLKVIMVTSTGAKDLETDHSEQLSAWLDHKQHFIFCHFFPCLSHIVVLVGILLVALHIVPVNKRLYPLLQVSRLEWKETAEVNTWGTRWHLRLFLYNEVWSNRTEKLALVIDFLHSGNLRLKNK